MAHQEFNPHKYGVDPANEREPPTKARPATTTRHLPNATLQALLNCVGSVATKKAQRKTPGLFDQPVKSGQNRKPVQPNHRAPYDASARLSAEPATHSVMTCEFADVCPFRLALTRNHTVSPTGQLNVYVPPSRPRVEEMCALIGLSLGFQLLFEFAASSIMPSSFVLL